MKRSFNQAGLDEELSTKRLRFSQVDHISRLSHELILRIISHLQPSDVCVCQRLSHKFYNLASDSSLWRTFYFERFVRPRSSRLPGLKAVGDVDGAIRFPSKTSKWLDEQHLTKHEARTNWKKQYKLRHNWSRGTCDVGEIVVSEKAHIPPMIVQMHDGIIFTADQKAGIRAWAAKDGRECVAQAELCSKSPPTAIATHSVEANLIRVVVGFEDGSFEIFRFCDQKKLTSFLNRRSDGGVITAAAMSWPYLVTMSALQKIVLYKAESRDADKDKSALRVLHSVESRNMWSPLSTSLRQVAEEVVISIAYAIPTYLSGWTVGVQETKLDKNGHFIYSRTASAIDQHYRPLAFTTAPMFSHFRPAVPGNNQFSRTEFQQIHSKPTSLSYTHPYLLVSHPDNTLTLYLVFSTAEELSISSGSRLWGHTSSISGAHVGGRGKAVSISRRGDELRIWELEGGFSSESARKRLATGDLSVRIKPGFQSPQPDTPSKRHSLSLENLLSTNKERDLESQDELTISRGWIGFDAENVAVLREDSDGKQALVVYDFT